MNYIGKRVRIKTIEELEAAGYKQTLKGSYVDEISTNPAIVDRMVPLCGTIGEVIAYDQTDNTLLVQFDNRWWYYGLNAVIILEEDDDEKNNDG